MSSKLEKGGGQFQGIKMLLCENPLPPLEAAQRAAEMELPNSNTYTEPYSQPLRQAIAKQVGVPEELIHINAGSELILRQIFARIGQQVHLLTPTYQLFPEIAASYTETRLLPRNDFHFDLNKLDIPDGTTLAVIVNPNNPTGSSFDMRPIPSLLARYPRTFFLVDEAFIGMGGETVAPLVPHVANLLVTRTFSKTESLAGLRIGYAILPEDLAKDLNANNDAYPLTRPSQAAALATLRNHEDIARRVTMLRSGARSLAAGLKALGVRTFQSESYFFLADFAPHDAEDLAAQLKERNILVRPLGDKKLGAGYMRITTSLPENNIRFLSVLKELL